VSYQIKYERAATKALKSFPAVEAKRVLAAIDSLASNPRPMQSKKLQGSIYHRIRVGDYRVVYEIRDAVLVVVVVRIGNRREVYRGL
jgi:mRNA interferase RelE/StbE